MTTPELLDALNSVITIPIVPYAAGAIDYPGYARNIEYLMANNGLDDGRKRVICIAGTSPIHHMEVDDQIRLLEETARVMAGDGLLMSAIVPNPIGTAGKLVERQSEMARPPDAMLLMPLSGVSNPEGVYATIMDFADGYGSSCGARFLYYHREDRDREAVTRLLNDSPHLIGVKIGTKESDVTTFVEGVGENAMVIWGVGDRSTLAAEFGAKGHTSGIAVVCAPLCDELNNAQRRGDLASSKRLEALLEPLEAIRFRDGRRYNYAAVVEAISAGGFDDVVGGEGAPFNQPVPPEIAVEVAAAIAPLRDYHAVMTSVR